MIFPMTKQRRRHLSHLWRFSLAYAKKFAVSTEPRIAIACEARSLTITLNRSLEVANSDLALQRDARVPQRLSRDRYAEIRRWSDRVLESCSRLNREALALTRRRPKEQDSAALLIAKEVFVGLIGLSSENRSLTLDLPDGKVSIITAPITVHGTEYDDEEDISLELGRFRLTVSLHDEDKVPFATALEPNLSDSGHPHPHVDHVGGICLGEGQTAVNKAMAAGRIADALEICESILDNYSAEDSFVRIGNWAGGGRCEACDERMREGYACHCCDYLACENCQPYCDQCDATVCCECQKKCDDCSRSCCTKCVIHCECGAAMCSDHAFSCIDCNEINGRSFCSECFHPDTRRCVNCQEDWNHKQELNNENGDDSEVTPGLPEPVGSPIAAGTIQELVTPVLSATADSYGGDPQSFNARRRADEWSLQSLVGFPASSVPSIESVKDMIEEGILTRPLGLPASILQDSPAAPEDYLPPSITVSQEGWEAVHTDLIPQHDVGATVTETSPTPPPARRVRRDAPVRFTSNPRPSDNEWDYGDYDDEEEEDLDPEDDWIEDDFIEEDDLDEDDDDVDYEDDDA
jgi:hypothetical protein